MHFYMRWTSSDLPLGAPGGVVEVIAEVCSDGFVCRELCLDSEGHIIRCAPTRSSGSVGAAGYMGDTSDRVHG